MEIVIHASGMPFNDNTIGAKALGGSETAAYYQAVELARRGHRVSVFTSKRGEDGRRGDPDVGWFHMGEVSEAAPLGDAFEYYTRHSPVDVLIIQRHPLAFHHKFNAKVCIYQAHDIALYRYAPAVSAGMWQTDLMTGVSDWHCKQLQEVFGTKPDCMATVPNGVNPELYVGEIDPELRAEWMELMVQQNGDLPPELPFLMLYQSRPERGLDHLVRPGGIMERLLDLNVHLLVAGYDNTTPQMAALYQGLRDNMARLPNVTNLGCLPKPELAQLQRTCHLLAYPTEFPEVSCITAMEAMHAGLPILSSEFAALPETCKDAGAILLPLLDGKADEEAFIEKVRFLASPEGRDTYVFLRGLQLKAAKTRTWEVAVDKLEQAIFGVFTGQQDPAAVARHCIAHSDIKFLDWYVHEVADTRHSRIFGSTIDEVSELYAFAHDPAKFLAHYDEHQGKYYDEFESKVIGEDVTSTSRFMGVANRINMEILRLKKSGIKPRFLDYGCAHGHYLMPLAAAFPDCEFNGVDISDRAIAAALQWAVRDKLTNVTLTIASQADLTPDNNQICPTVWAGGMLDEVEDGNTVQEVESELHLVPELYDIIYAGEVLEHVWDWKDLMERFRSVLKPDGLLIITTPTGRWEWTGTEAFRRAREHLHHFERDDIGDICRGHQLILSHASASHDNARGALGSWVWEVRFVDGVPIGDIDYERKLCNLAPRQTISACLIVKNGERTIRRCFDSFIDWVDEVVIGIDPATNDRTVDIVNTIRADFPRVPFTVFQLEAPVLESGFAAARNQTLDLAEGSWILWLDADEEVQTPGQLWKYARHSSVDALSLAQVHYATDPPAVLTTDHPCRFFRKSSGARFHGVVHEHPETEQGKAIPFTAMRNDVSFLHGGYVDEDVRRNRYKRNLPLLKRDVIENPNRELNKFLWLRDIAQGMVFEMEATGGRVTDAHRVSAQKGVDLFEEMLPKGNLRMLIDAVQYYSACVQLCAPRAFQAEFVIRTVNPMAPDLSCATTTNGVFAKVSHYIQLINRIAEEATAKYENEHL